MRVYADTLHLSKELHRSGIIGGDARSISPFIAGFNSSNASFEFIDAGDQREDVIAKVESKKSSPPGLQKLTYDQGMFTLSVEDPRCAHVLFAGCHSAEYMSLLETHWQKVGRFSLVAAGPMDDTYASIGLDIDDLSSVFHFASETNHEVNIPHRPKSAPEVRIPGKPQALKATENSCSNGTALPVVCKYFARVSPASKQTTQLL